MICQPVSHSTFRTDDFFFLECGAHTSHSNFHRDKSRQAEESEKIANKEERNPILNVEYGHDQKEEIAGKKESEPHFYRGTL